MTASPQFLALAESLLECRWPNICCKGKAENGLAFNHLEACPAIQREAIATALEAQFNVGLEKGAELGDYLEKVERRSDADRGVIYGFADQVRDLTAQIRALKTPAGKQEEK